MSHYAVYPFPFDQLKIGYQGEAVTLLARTQEPVREEGRTPFTDLVFRQITEYWNGQRRAFDFPLLLQGTPFQQKVWKALVAIPYGETRTYGEVAAAIGCPKACRAVGMANRRNPVLMAVPCHRVVGANGALTGYAGGLEWKQALLRLEREGLRSPA